MEFKHICHEIFVTTVYKVSWFSVKYSKMKSHVVNFCFSKDKCLKVAQRHVVLKMSSNQAQIVRQGGNEDEAEGGDGNR